MATTTASPPFRHRNPPAEGERCPACKKGVIAVGVEPDVTRAVCRVRFTANLPAAQCRLCLETFYAPAVQRAFTLAIAAELLGFGVRDGEALKFAREALRLSIEELATLLDTTTSFIRNWEGDVLRDRMDTPRFVLLGQLVREERLGTPHIRWHLLNALEERTPTEPVQVEVLVHAADGGGGSGSSGKSRPKARTER